MPAAAPPDRPRSRRALSTQAKATTAAPTSAASCNASTKAARGQQERITGGPRALLECNRIMTSTDFRAELRALDLPVSIVQGGRDASLPLPLTGRPSQALIRGARLTVYEGAPHGLFLTHAERLNHDLAAFARG